ncbi:hypothetical protein [Parabacteroides provencensis]|uniref:hypothetical protein n=1 Tax=Parabacteroides provencensis TaxID=1944636 RepID=UPI000C14F098|nr:hypothetical protein [Parabacteroides provencensis]
MQLAKLDNGQLITTYADDQDKDIINQMVADGFKIYVEEQPQTIQLSEFQSQELRYRDEGFQIVGYYEVVDNNPDRITAEIDRLKSELTATDYLIIKSYEYALTGQPLPYYLANLHSERQLLRNRINELEQLC